MRNKIALLIAGGFLLSRLHCVYSEAYSLETEPLSLNVIRKIYNKSQSWQTRRQPGLNARSLTLS